MRVNKITDPKTVKMTNAELKRLSYRNAGTLQVRREGTKHVYFYFSEPSLGRLQENVMCSWERGIATIPGSWI